MKQQKEHTKYTDPAKFYQHNYPAEFTCPHEERIGGTKGSGGKWLCNPRNIAIASADRVQNRGNACLVYTSSANLNEFQFERELLDTIGPCEIHVFHPNDIDQTASIPPTGVQYHPWGFKPSSNADIHDPQLKTIQETVKELGHEGYTIDLLSLDCQGCEFDIYRDLLMDHEIYAPVFMQLLIQVHGAPAGASGFFRALQENGYVTFHKSPSAEGTGKEQDYGFLKLSQDFFVSV